LEFAVLVKVVPAAESATFDPARKTIRRDEGEQFLNPFDQRAIRVALDLRRPGETVTVVSMGPLSAAAAVEGTIALGVDRAILVSDPVLAGSDSFVTARVLARVLAERPAGLVILGKWTTDSETGQVPAELAERLGRPLLSAARSLRRAAEADRFEGTVETETGSARATFSAPAVISVGEKIAKPAKPPEGGVASPPLGSFERFDAARLGFSAGDVGLLGSPTVVGELTDQSPHRGAVRFDAGPPVSRVAGALAALRLCLGGGDGNAGSGRWAERAEPSTGTALVLASDERGRADSAALGLLSEIRRSLPSLRATAVYAGATSSSTDMGRLAAAGAEHVVWLPAASGSTARTTAAALDDLLAHDETVETAMFVSHAFGREVAGRLAVRRGLGLTGDAISFSARSPGELRFVKPALGGGLLAEIATRTRPALATVRPGGFAAGELRPAPEIQTDRGPMVEHDPSIAWAGWDDEPPDGLADPDSARIVVSVGMGAVDMLPAIRTLCSGWGAALVGTRRVVDAGHLPVSRQVGLTGRWVAPEIGVLLGVRGSPNHLVAWRRARALLAVNPDPTAPVFGGVDVGIVGRCDEVLSSLGEELPRLLPHRRAP